MSTAENESARDYNTSALLHPTPRPEGRGEDFEPARSWTRTEQTSPRVTGGSLDAVIEMLRRRAQPARFLCPDFLRFGFHRVDKHHARGGHERRVGTSTRAYLCYTLYDTVLYVSKAY